MAISLLFACAPKDGNSSASNFIISFNTNGGSTIKSLTLKAGSSLTLPEEPTKEGFVFTGWYLDNECKREVNVNLFRVVGNTTIFAGWESVETYRHFIKIDKKIEDGEVKVLTPEDGRASLGQNVSISVVPYDGYVLKEGSLFAGEIVPTHDSANVYTFIMPSESVTITCEFELAPLPLNVLNNFENGQIILSSDSARPGEYVTVQAIPEYGYRLSELYYVNNDGGDKDNAKRVSIMSSSAFYMGQTETFIGASFEKIDGNVTYKVKTESNVGGTIILENVSVPAGVFVPLKIVPDDGYRLEKYVVKGNSLENFIIKTDNEGFIMPAEEVTITAQFAEIKSSDPNFELTIGQSEGGLVSIINPRNLYKEGEKISLAVFPNEGYELKNLFVNGINLVGYSFTMPKTEAIVSAEFVKLGHKINVTSTNCDVVLSSFRAYAGDLVEFEVVPHLGYKVPLGSIMVDGKQYLEKSFIMPDHVVEISAIAYESTITYPITIGSMEHGTLYASQYEASEHTRIEFTVEPDEGYRLAHSGLKITYNGKTENLFGNTFIMPSCEVVASAVFEPVYKVNSYEDGRVGIYPNKDEIGVGEVVRFKFVAHSDVVVNSIFAELNFGSYSEGLAYNGTFELTTKILDMAGENPQLSLSDVRASDITSSTYSITVNESVGGKVKVLSSSYARYGAPVRLLIEEDSGYKLEKIELRTNTGDSFLVGDTFIMPKSTVTLVPTFIEVDELGFGLGAQYNRNVESFRKLGINAYYFREKYQIYEKYPGLINHPFINYLVGFVKVSSDTGHDFYILEVNDVDKVTPIARTAHEFISDYLSVREEDIKVSINYNYVILSNGGNPKEDFYLFKNGLNQVGDFLLYEREDGSYGVYSYLGDEKYVSIPETHNGRSITYLSQNTFSNPENICGISLGYVKELGDFALKNTSIKYVDLKCVEKLGVGVFMGANNLISFSTSSTNEYLYVENGVLFVKKKSVNVDTLYAYPTAKTAPNDAYNIPSNTTSLAPYAFYKSSLTTISFGSELSVIGDYAFKDSALINLKHITRTAKTGHVDMSKGIVAVIGKGAFSGCYGLNSFYLDSVTFIGKGAITWDGQSNVMINLSLQSGGVVITDGDPVMISSTISPDVSLVINVPQNLRELYKNSEKWAVYVDGGYLPVE